MLSYLHQISYVPDQPSGVSVTEYLTKKSLKKSRRNKRRVGGTKRESMEQKMSQRNKKRVNGTKKSRQN